MFRKTAVSKVALLGVILAIGAIALAPSAMAREFRVTIRNATYGQPVAPSVIATHSEEFKLFELGPAPMPGDSDYALYFGLATAAETGFPVPLFDAVSASDGVWEAVVLAKDNGEGVPPVLFPGESNSTTIRAYRDAKYLSAAAMLGATNDAIYAVRDIPLPKYVGGITRVDANAYDVGSEDNAESAVTVGALGAMDDDGPNGIGINDGSGEGFICVHPGIHGVGGPDGLDPAIHDWRDPVVEVTIERIR